MVSKSIKKEKNHDDSCIAVVRVRFEPHAWAGKIVERVFEDGTESDYLLQDAYQVAFAQRKNASPMDAPEVVFLADYFFKDRVIKKEDLLQMVRLSEFPKAMQNYKESLTRSQDLRRATKSSLVLPQNNVQSLRHN